MLVSDNVFDNLMLSLSTSKEDYHVGTYPHFHKYVQQFMSVATSSARDANPSEIDQYFCQVSLS